MAQQSGSGRRVFLSHTSELRQHPASPMSFVAAAEDAVKRTGDVPVDMAFFTAAPQPPSQVCRAAVESCQVYVVIAGFRYGSPVRDEPQHSYTELEFEAATAARLPRYAFLLDEDAEGPGALFRDREYADRQEAFRQRLLDCGITVATFRRPDELTSLVLQALQRPIVETPRPDGRGTAWNIPARSVEVTGRDDLLDTLHTTLRAEGRVVARAALSGIGGIGKTTAAIEHAHRRCADYDIAWWVAAEDPTLIPEALSGLAQALALAEVTDTADVAIARLFAALAHRDRWLLIFDNAQGPRDLTRFIPPGPGHVLFTSRNPEWSGTAAPVSVEVFDRPDSIALLRRRRPDLSEPHADAIAAALGDLPQVVDQAARLLADSLLAPDDYLTRLRTRTADILARGVPEGTTASAAASWSITFDRLSDDDPAALHLLTLLAWLGPEPLPRRHLTTILGTGTDWPAPLAAVTADPLDVAERLTLLARRGVVVTTPQTVQLHRVPAALVRDRTRGDAGQPCWAALAVRALGRTVPPEPWNNPEVWPDWADLLPHVLAVTDPDRIADLR